MFRNKYLKRLFFAFLIIFILFSSCFLIVVQVQNGRAERERQQNANAVIFDQTVQTVDRQMELAIALMSQITENTYFKDRLQESENPFYDEIWLKDELKRQTNVFGDTIFELAVIDTVRNRSVDKNYSMTVEQYFADMGLPGVTSQTLLEKLREDNNFALYVVFGIQNELFMVQPALLHAADRYLVLCHIKSDYLYDILSPGSQQMTFVISKEDNLLFSNQEAPWFEALREQELYQNAARVRREVALDGQLISLQKSANSPVTYVIAFPETDAGLAFGWYILLILLLALLMFPVAALISKLAYRPVGDMVQSVRRIGGAAPGQDELLYVRKTVENINRLNGELHKIIDKNKVSLRIRFLKDYLLGLERMDEGKLTRYGIPNGPIQLAVLEIGGFEFGKSFSDEIRGEVKGRILRILSEQLSINFECDIVDMSYDRYCLLVYGEDEGLREILSQLLVDIDENFALKVVAAMSHGAEPIERLPSVYMDSENMLENRYVFGGKLVLMPEDYESVKFESYYYPFEMERELIGHILDGRYEDAMGVVSRLLMENLDVRNFDKDTRARFVMAITGTVNRILERVQLTEADVFSDGSLVYVDLKLCKTNQELKVHIERLFAKLIEELSKRNVNINTYMSQKIEKYIEENYMHDISLRDLAEYFGYSVTYMSGLFKSTVKENFKDYLNKRRVSKAKEIMDKQKNIPIRELIKLVGCNNEDTFIRMFKRYEGITPGKYAKQDTEE